jgi:phage antirepressor YoqD-like protein
VYLQVHSNQYGGTKEIQDYSISVEMAKHICLMSRTDEGRKCRQYLIDLEKAWNTPEQVMARALKLADRTIYELKLKIEEQRQKVEYHDTVLNKDGLITTTVVAKDLGFKSAAKLNQIMNLNGIIFKNKSGTWCPYAEYEWLITDGYADYQSYEAEKAKPCLKWTEKGRKWIVDNYNGWVMKLVG